MGRLKRAAMPICLASWIVCAAGACGPEVIWIHPGPEELDASAKTFSVRPDAGSIYVVASGYEWIGPFAEVFLDGNKVGPIDAGKYRFLSVRPGEHRVGAGWADVRSSVELAVEAGAIYFVRVTIEGGIWNESTETVEVIEEAEGRKLVRDATLAGELRGVLGSPVRP